MISQDKRNGSCGIADDLSVKICVLGAKKDVNVESFKVKWNKNIDKTYFM